MQTSPGVSNAERAGVPHETTACYILSDPLTQDFPGDLPVQLESRVCLGSRREYGRARLERGRRALGTAATAANNFLPWIRRGRGGAHGMEPMGPSLK